MKISTNCQRSSMYELIKLIDKYLMVGKNFLTIFFNEKKIKMPKSDIAWVCNIFKQGGCLKGGITYFKHGIGINFKDNNWEIDIDFGAKGEYDGVDSWKLFLFIINNKIKTNIKNEDEIQNLLNEGVKSGVFIKRKKLYFKKLKS